jgi:hypothetical protein
MSTILIAIIYANGGVFVLSLLAMFVEAILNNPWKPR